MPPGNLKPKIVSKNINTIIGKIIDTKSKYKILLSPQKKETKIDKTEIPRKKSKVTLITENIIKLAKVI